MKRYSLLLPLLAVVFAVACTDSTSPANSHALLAPRNPDLGVIGNKPPPPVDAAIVITISSPVTFYGSFTGVYFANGTSVESAAAAQQIGDESLTFLGSAWLRLNNVQPAGYGASANARFQRTETKLFGNGTLMIGDVTIRIDEVTSFKASPTCEPGQLCAEIDFNATIGNDHDHTGHAVAFGCGIVTPPEGEPYYTCGSE